MSDSEERYQKLSDTSGRNDNRLAERKQTLLERQEERQEETQEKTQEETQEKTQKKRRRRRRRRQRKMESSGVVREQKDC